MLFNYHIINIVASRRRARHMYVIWPGPGQPREGLGAVCHRRVETHHPEPWMMTDNSRPAEKKYSLLSIVLLWICIKILWLFFGSPQHTEEAWQARVKRHKNIPNHCNTGHRNWIEVFMATDILTAVTGKRSTPGMLTCSPVSMETRSLMRAILVTFPLIRSIHITPSSCRASGAPKKSLEKQNN